jgi:hypothetical protein
VQCTLPRVEPLLPQPDTHTATSCGYTAIIDAPAAHLYAGAFAGGAAATCRLVWSRSCLNQTPILLHPPFSLNQTLRDDDPLLTACQ